MYFRQLLNYKSYHHLHICYWDDDKSNGSSRLVNEGWDYGYPHNKNSFKLQLIY